MKDNILINNLDILFPDAKCELEYNKDYELLIATVLSAQCTDKRVNQVTKVLFSKYSLEDLSKIDLSEIESIIYPVGTFKKKAKFIQDIAKSLLENYDGKVPNNRKYLESLPGVGRKTCNVVLANIYNVPTIAVDTHMIRVSNRLGLVNDSDPVKIEKVLMKKLPKDKWNRLNHQMILFGRYICKSQKPDCNNCIFKNNCKYQSKN